MKNYQTACLGYPRIGSSRELKKALESFWKGNISEHELSSVASEIRKKNWQTMLKQNVDFIPSNDFSFYDQMLDMAVMLGSIPKRYANIDNPVEQYFAMARGIQKGKVDLEAMEMTKWFDTNYHYIVPELEDEQNFELNPRKILNELSEAKSLGISTRPVLIGPISFLLLSKKVSGHSEKSTLKLIGRIIPTYIELLGLLKKEKIEWVQFDEPCLSLELSTDQQKIFLDAHKQISASQLRPQIMLTTYFDELGSNLEIALDSNYEGLHLDLVRGSNQLDQVLNKINNTMILSLGLIDGRNIWKTDLDHVRDILLKVSNRIGPERNILATSCSLLHCPVDLEVENDLDEEVKSWLAFSKQKLFEIKALATNDSDFLLDQRNRINARKYSDKTNNQLVKNRQDNITPSMKHRSQFKLRMEAQKKRLLLPNFPTTTIGSFPQTKSVRKARADWRSGKLASKDYLAFLRKETEQCIRRQEDLGLDVLVHGEFERTDMVEYFGEKLQGFAFTKKGWVQSYGSRCVKPPILFGDVLRTTSMTVDWAKYSQSLTHKPVKGMLTGPVTILQWSFVRDDQARKTTCEQIALALRDEIVELEKAGIAIIQVDEPAIREGLPLRKKDWHDYLKWSVDAFRLATSGVMDETQIHTHMCYSEFGDVLDAVARLDADVLSIETSRSRMEILDDFAEFKYPNEVGPGVYDIHSPRVPSAEEMAKLLFEATKVLPSSQLWVNPDCGLKTRTWEEVAPALNNMVKAAAIIRQSPEFC